MTTPLVLCGFCGGGPADFGTFRSVLVILIGLSVQSRSGTFCRDCALAVFREQQKLTLVTGWWGLPALAAPIILVRNANELNRFKELAPPRYDTEPPPEVGDRFGRPLAPGHPVTKSPVLFVPILLAVALLVFCCGPRFLYD